MATICSFCNKPASICGSYAKMKEPANWRGRLSGRYWPGPAGSHALAVGDDPSWNWSKVAAADGWKPLDVIYYNFGTHDPREVNWYLYHFVGCRHSPDGNQNLSFRGAKPGVIYTRRYLTGNSGGGLARPVTVLAWARVDGTSPL